MTSRSGKEGLNVRQRVQNLELGRDSFNVTKAESKRKISRSKLIPWIYTLLYPFGILFALFQFVLYMDSRLPSPITIQDVVNKKGSPFSAERVMGHLNLLTGIGPRVAGSHENEIVAVDFLLREIKWATASLTARDKVSLTVMRRNLGELQITERVLISTQRADGWFYLAFKPHGMMNTYEGLQNIVVKIVSKTNSTSSLLINCHFDSVPTSPGASDDGVHCAIMLELLRVLSEPDAPSLPHNVIFLFNGAEENPLQASHAFIAQHEWAKEVQAFINLEAAGAGSKEILFQTGPGNSWLVKAYADSTPHPSGNVMGEEIFQSGLVPSDTDFRVFRDFGKVPGLDFAYARNGYVYHTKYDDTSRIPLGTIQHTGENLLALIPQVLSAPEFSHSKENNSKLTNESLNDKCIYFDVFGLFMVKYSEGVALALNLVTVFLSVVTIFGKRFGTFHSRWMESRGWAIVNSSRRAIVGWIIGAVLTSSTAVILDYLGHPLTWFSRPALIFPLFYCPFLGGCLISYVFMPSSYSSGRNLHADKSQVSADEWDKVYMDSLGVQLIWTVITLAATTLGIRSSYIFTSLILIPVLAHICVALMYKMKFYPAKTCIIMRQVFSLASVMFIFYNSILAFSLFVPIAGRIGAKLNPDLLIGAIAVLFCLMTFSQILPLIHLVDNPKKVTLSLFAIHLLALLAVTQTPIGFPYGSKPTEPTPQRAQVLHVRSRQHLPGPTEQIKQKNIFWMVDLDRNGAHFSLPKAVESGCHLVSPQMCKEELVCGMPVYMCRMVDLLPNTHIVPAPEPIIHEPSHLKLISTKALTTDTRRLTFNITGADHMSLLISPAKGVTLQGWAFGGIPNATYFWQENRPLYYIYHTMGLRSGEAWVVWIDLKVPNHINKRFVVDVALIAHYNHGDPAFQATKIVNEHLGPVAPWAHLISWTATYDGWKF